MIELPYAVIIALASALVGGAVAWGALRSTVSTLRELVTEVKVKVEALARLEVTLTRADTTLSHHGERLSALERWRDGRAGATGQHEPVRG